MKYKKIILGLLIGLVSVFLVFQILDNKAVFANDPHSFARPEEVVVNHLNLNIA